MNHETTTTTTDAGELGELDPAELAEPSLAFDLSAMFGFDPSVIAGAAGALSEALETLHRIEHRTLGIETVLRAVLAGAPMTPKMRRNLIASLAEAGLDPSSWLP